MPTPKRFIAGAVCPRCAEMDKIMMFTTDDDDQVRECVACGFTDAVSDAPTPPANPELETRVNKRGNEDDHTVKQVVFFSSKDD
ncbi:YheV family putative metal-binding protein [Marinobacter sp. 71-i]|uniref:YheV family putative metal-binding protein n=1 Tax=Marinobacter iranensis TaxID=2962607 RepID=A0ABT5YCL7_9GAMM|nr:YheV family putative zinc ribbon protein [Marinobacter iranensis]MDF0751415.1 YheV family putative metal-binding protein [Marinobacter iranensis]